VVCRTRISDWWVLIQGVRSVHGVRLRIKWLTILIFLLFQPFEHLCEFLRSLRPIRLLGQAAMCDRHFINHIEILVNCSIDLVNVWLLDFFLAQSTVLKSFNLSLLWMANARGQLRMLSLLSVFLTHWVSQGDLIREYLLALSDRHRDKGRTVLTVQRFRRFWLGAWEMGTRGGCWGRLDILLWVCEHPDVVVHEELVLFRLFTCQS